MAGYLNSKVEDIDIVMLILGPKLIGDSTVTMATESNKTLFNCYHPVCFKKCLFNPTTKRECVALDKQVTLTG